jgi:uncharacterized protein YndB with AHSA1/START domain
MFWFGPSLRSPPFRVTNFPMFKWLFGKRSEDDGGSALPAGGNGDLVVVSRKVPLPRAEAFAAFVDRIGTWWPRDATWSGERLATFGVEPRLNGRATETDTSGTSRTWGTVLSIERPSHIVIAWQIGPDRDPELSEATSSRVDVRFSEIDPQTTEVVVVHRDFPRHGDGWKAYRAKMGAKDGWPRLIGLYAKSVGA